MTFTASKSRFLTQTGLLLIALTLICQNLLAQDSTTLRNFNGNQYVNMEGKWYLVNPSDQHKTLISENTITIKFQNSTTTQQINSFEQNNNLQLLRKTAQKFMTTY